MSSENCTCGHPWNNHYDGVYCLESDCGCGPCEECSEQFQELPINIGVCPDCRAFEEVVEPLFEETSCVKAPKTRA